MRYALPSGGGLHARQVCSLTSRGLGSPSPLLVGGLAVVEAGLGRECASHDWGLTSLQRDQWALTDGEADRKAGF